MSEAKSVMMPDRPWKMTVVGLVVFFLLGPLVARSIWRLSFYALGEVPDFTEETPENIADVISALIGDIPIMYLVLGPAFSIIGGVLAVYGLRKGRPPVWLAACPVVAFFGGILLYDLVVPPPPDVTPKLLILPALSSIVAAISCGLITRRFWQVRKAG